ncbi:hypothetical protein EDC04DRAFT_2605018 [Pisolithus marmoratus]|nr:hypothetical protein EDC04DRAFT_2605018 [Pisolithus marmoratus]
MKLPVKFMLLVAPLSIELRAVIQAFSMSDQDKTGRLVDRFIQELRWPPQFGSRLAKTLNRVGKAADTIMLSIAFLPLVSISADWIEPKSSALFDAAASKVSLVVDFFH